MEEVVMSISDIGLTILGIAIAWIGIVWLDRNVFNKNRYKGRK
jgi:hypothetical protein